MWSGREFLSFDGIHLICARCRGDCVAGPWVTVMRDGRAESRVDHQCGPDPHPWRRWQQAQRLTVASNARSRRTHPNYPIYVTEEMVYRNIEGVM